MFLRLNTIRGNRVHNKIKSIERHLKMPEAYSKKTVTTYRHTFTSEKDPSIKAIIVRTRIDRIFEDLYERAEFDIEVEIKDDSGGVVKAKMPSRNREEIKLAVDVLEDILDEKLEELSNREEDAFLTAKNYLKRG